MVQCKNNLKQIGIALNLYHGSKNRFPMSNMEVLCTDSNKDKLEPYLGEWVDPPGSNKWVTVSVGTMGVPSATADLPGALMQLLPYTDMSFLWDKYDPLANDDGSNGSGLYPLSDSANQEVVETVIPMFLCPSMETGNFTGRGPSSYRSSTGTNHPMQGKHHDGAITGSTIVRMKHITDGISRTFAFMESDWFGGSNGGRWAGGYWAGRQGGTYGTPEYYKYCNGTIDLETYSNPNIWVLNPKAYPTDYYSQKFYGSAPRSDHPGGMHFVMVDGSVHFLSESTERIVMDSLASRDRGEAYDIASTKD